MTDHELEQQALAEHEYYARRDAQLNSPKQLARRLAAAEQKRLNGEAKQDRYIAYMEDKAAQRAAKAAAKVAAREEKRAARARKRTFAQNMRRAIKADKQRVKQQAWTPEQREQWNAKKRAYYKVRRDKVKAEITGHVYEAPFKPDPLELARINEWFKERERERLGST